jgi:hypothetical protein
LYSNVLLVCISLSKGFKLSTPNAGLKQHCLNVEPHKLVIQETL